MSDNETTGEIDSEEEALKRGLPLPAVYLKHIERAKKDEEAWRKSAKAAITVYEAGRPEKGEGETPAFNILHSNIETTVPALYNSTPIPDIRRRFGDADGVAKLAVDVIERGLSYTVDEYDFDATMREATRDGELAGRGTARVRYEPTTQPQVGPDGQPMMGPDGQPMQAVGKQLVTCEHVIWDKWGHGPARAWSEVPWIYFEHDFTESDLREIGVSDERITSLSLNDQHEDGKAEASTGVENKGILKTCRVYEIWDKRHKAVLFIAEQDKERVLAAKPDPLKLVNFFPVPTPLQPLRRRADLTPICPYEVYKPLVEELDRVTKRIRSLVNQLRVRGLIDQRLAKDFERLKFCDDGQYEPADDASVFAGGGGLDKAIAHWPMQETIAALQQLYQQREQVKQTIYEVTGLSDVLRGATNPNETLGAQQLKAQVGSQRLSTRQGQVARFARDLFRLKAEIMCTHFSPENLQAMTQVQITPEVVDLLRNEMMRAYRIDIESDSTIRADVARSQEQMTQFLSGTAQYAQSMASVLQLAPGATGAVVEIYAAFARHFKLGKSAEDALEKLVQAAQQPQEPQPSPEEQKAQAELQRMQAEMQMKGQQAQADMAIAQQKAQLELQMAQIKAQMLQLEFQTKQQLAGLEIQKAQADIALKRESMEMDREAKIFDMQSRQQMSEIDIEARRRKADAPIAGAAE